MGKKFLPFLFSSFVRAICVREGANECWHYTGINHDLVVNTLGDNCGRYLKASEWIIFPNYFQDESIEDAEARLSIISESLPHLDYEQSELTCALMFPKCQRNICSTNLEHTFLFTQSYNVNKWNCERISSKSRHIFDPMMHTVFTNGQARRKSRFHCDGLPESIERKIETKSIPYTQGVNSEECRRRVKTLYHFKDWIYVERYLTCLITLYGSSSMKIYKIGSSTRNLPLIAVKITEPDTEETRRHAKPKVRLMGNIHGNEDQGIFILLPLIRDILDGTQEYALLRKSLELHFLISANPDGYLRARATYRSNGKICWTCGRQNRNRVDLNRNFPLLIEEIIKTRERFAQTGSPVFAGAGNQVYIPIPSSYWSIGNVQEETLSLIKWTRSRNFVLSAMIHSGAWVVNYPYDTSKRHPLAEAHENEDANAFKKISRDFVKLHKTLIKQEPCMHGADEFSEKGITNGAAWYSTIGTLQDFEYIAEGVMSFTLELGCEKTTSKANLPIIYSDAKDAMIDFMWHGYMGIRGKIEDEKGRGIPKAEVFIQEKFWNGTTALNPLSTLTDDDGHYNKLFWPDDMTASITLFIQHEKYQERRFPFTDEFLASLKNFRSCRRTYSSLTDSSCNYELPKALVIKLHKL